MEAKQRDGQNGEGQRGRAVMGYGGLWGSLRKGEGGWAGPLVLVAMACLSLFSRLVWAPLPTLYPRNLSGGKALLLDPALQA